MENYCILGSIFFRVHDGTRYLELFGGKKIDFFTTGLDIL